MAPLSTELRTQLSNAIKAARREAEAGAHNALQSLAVDRHEPHASMTPDERSLRNRLRAHGRQLGDLRDKTRGTQSIDRLAHEVAYEHWHRMLFARFLAENHLLIEPDSGVTITMEECEELARDEGEDPRALAARFAQASLPQIFRSDDPVLEVELAPEVRQALDKLLENLPDDVFTADDSLGWTYQYWQADKKDAVNESGNKIGADELPAVTQLFTEHYMVLFLYHNTIGAWHAGKVLAANPDLARTAQNEEELRDAVSLRSLGGYDFEYLRFVRESQEGDNEETPTGPWRPASGAFEGWPKTAQELKVLDPCCGSGHFLVEGFALLVRLRIDEEGLDLDDAVRLAISDNLYGLELDPRCTQIAAFNIALAAWRIAKKNIELPPMNIACSGLALGATRAEWLQLAGDDSTLRAGMEWLHELFNTATDLGSLIDPRAATRDMRQIGFDVMQPLLTAALRREADTPERMERAVAAQGMAKAAELLSGEYTLTITNVPYLKRGNQGDVLKNFADKYYGDAKAELATMFVRRMIRWVSKNGTAAAVTPQSWLFLTSYKHLRNRLLTELTWNSVARLGPGAFETISGEVVNVALLSLSCHAPTDSDRFCAIDAGKAETPRLKAAVLKGRAAQDPQGNELDLDLKLVEQSGQLDNPDARIVFGAADDTELLAAYATSHKGVTTGDDPRARRRFWEFDAVKPIWKRMQTTIKTECLYGGLHEVMLWGDHGEANDWGGLEIRGEHAWGRKAVAVNMMGELLSCMYSGVLWDQNFAVVLPKDDKHLSAIWAFCQSPNYTHQVRQIDKSIKVTNATLVKVPFDVSHWESVAAKKYPTGIPEPRSNDPTQWIFHGHPTQTEDACVLQVAVGRLVGYRWPAELDSEIHLAQDARRLVARCRPLDRFSDEDGILCLSATRGERPAVERLRELLSAAFGSRWSSGKEREILAAAGDGKKPASSLEVWLRDNFFEEHCKLFQHRPFVWHLWDGNRDGFHCLVNAHKLTGTNGQGRRTLQAIAFSYLNDWIDRQKADQQRGIEGSDARLAAAQALQDQLEKILEGEPPFDLFVRWKPLHEQAIGWEPDVDDGVRLNIRPFMKGELQKGGKKGAGILRWKPNIKWAKDRGKEPLSLRPKEDFPWFWACLSDGTEEERTNFAGGADFDGNRWNDLHYTNKFKKAARHSSGEGSAE